ncbi:MAG: flagellar motor switch protein FliN [Treponema sp.]|jgi:flagellar motor switch protein FliN/FliY|nr:flagellar motor switch protein FliN [Treponema sp.]
MSDGALSQSEIDALLGGMGGGSKPASSDSPKGNEGERKALEGCLASTVNELATNLSKFIGSTATVTGPSVAFFNRDSCIDQLPDSVTVIKADFIAGFPGEHIFIMAESTAKELAGMVNHEENIQMDDMALSVIGEVISTLVGSQITTLTAQTANKSIAPMSPEATNVPKAVAALPNGTFPVATYTVDLGKGTQNLWEVFGPTIASDIARALRKDKSTTASTSTRNTSKAGGTQQMAAQSTNVQPVQFPTLMPHITSQEQGNIGLIMDVFMEMTVELGRTRKVIKEILSMGEGTIIELDKLAGEPVDILVNHKLIAKGEVVVIDENFGVRVTEIVSPMERMSVT